MKKTFTVFLTTPPYSFENTLTAARIAEGALKKGHHVRLVASGDGVYCFLKKQKSNRIHRAGDLFTKLLSQGLKLYLSEECINDRHPIKNDYMDTAEIISLKGLFKIMNDTDIWINL